MTRHNFARPKRKVANIESDINNADLSTVNEI
jgi:hypothetical protein